MRLTKARITNYKSIEDSEEFSVDELTCLAGKNESGKTAILQALRRLNPVEPSESQFDFVMEYPRSKSYGITAEEAGNVLETTWQLSDDDLAALEAELGPESFRDAEVVIRKGYNNKTWYTLPIDQRAVIRHISSGVTLTDAARKRVEKYSTVDDAIAGIDRLADKATKDERSLAEALSKLPNNRPFRSAISILSPRLPKFLYFDTYEALPGRISVEALTETDETDLTSGERIFLALLALAGTSLEEISETKLSERLIAQLEGVSNSLSRDVFEYWTQNRDLKVQFRYDPALSGDEPPFNEGHVFSTRIENLRHRVSVRFDERSAGFVWFFSFLVWFSQMEREYGDKLVILLDEPGLSLHGKAQGDLLRYIKEKLLPKYQVLYSTHSPFMIDASDLFTVRTVEDVVLADGEILGTKVGDEVLSADADTIFPLRAALGYDITQSLFVGEHTLLVEGPSDFLYLVWASNELRSRDSTALDTRWVITPTGGIDKIGSFIALFGANKLHVAVLTDYHAGDKQKVARLRDLDILRAGHVFSAESFTMSAEADIEDMLGRDLYLALVAAAYSLGAKDRFPTVGPTTASQLVAAEVAEHMSTVSASVPAFDHYAPAAYLVENWGDLKGHLPGVDQALDRFEEFFKQLNALL